MCHTVYVQNSKRINSCMLDLLIVKDAVARCSEALSSIGGNRCLSRLRCEIMTVSRHCLEGQQTV